MRTSRVGHSHSTNTQVMHTSCAHIQTRIAGRPSIHRHGLGLATGQSAGRRAVALAWKAAHMMSGSAARTSPPGAAAHTAPTASVAAARQDSMSACAPPARRLGRRAAAAGWGRQWRAGRAAGLAAQRKRAAHAVHGALRGSASHWQTWHLLCQIGQVEQVHALPRLSTRTRMRPFIVPQMPLWPWCLGAPWQRGCTLHRAQEGQSPRLREVHVAAQVRQHARHVRRESGAHALGRGRDRAQRALLHARAAGRQQAPQARHHGLQELGRVLLCARGAGAASGRALPRLPAWTGVSRGARALPHAQPAGHQRAGPGAQPPLPGGAPPRAAARACPQQPWPAHHAGRTHAHPAPTERMRGSAALRALSGGAPGSAPRTRGRAPRCSHSASSA